MIECYFCEKEYEIYPVIICSDIECMIFEQHVKELYYSDHEDHPEGKSIGICKKCRDKHIYDNKIFRWRALLNIELRIHLIIQLMEMEGKDTTKWDAALKRVHQQEKKYESMPEIQEVMRKNNPAGFKEPPAQKEKCAYCGENHGQLWINNPNGNWSKDTCWWVCKPCEKIIELQETDAMTRHIGHIMEKKSFNDVAEVAKKESNKINKKIL